MRGQASDAERRQGGSRPGIARVPRAGRGQLGGDQVSDTDHKVGKAGAGRRIPITQREGRVCCVWMCILVEAVGVSPRA